MLHHKIGYQPKAGQLVKSAGSRYKAPASCTHKAGALYAGASQTGVWEREGEVSRLRWVATKFIDTIIFEMLKYQ